MVHENPYILDDEAAVEERAPEMTANLETYAAAYSTWLTFFQDNPHSWVDINNWITGHNDAISQLLISFLPENMRSGCQIMATTYTGENIHRPVFLVRRGDQYSYYNPLNGETSGTPPLNLRVLQIPAFRNSWIPVSSLTAEFLRPSLPTEQWNITQITTVNGYVFATGMNQTTPVFMLRSDYWCPVASTVLARFIPENEDHQWFYNRASAGTIFDAANPELIENTEMAPVTLNDEQIQALFQELITIIRDDEEFQNNWINANQRNITTMSASQIRINSILNLWRSLPYHRRGIFSRVAGTSDHLSFNNPENVFFRVIENGIYYRESALSPLTWYRLSNPRTGEWQRVPVFEALRLYVSQNPARFANGASLDALEAAEILAVDEDLIQIAQGSFYVHEGRLRCRVDQPVASPDIVEDLLEEDREGTIRSLQAQLSGATGIRRVRLQAHLYIERAYAETPAVYIRNLEEFIREATTSGEPAVVERLRQFIAVLEEESKQPPEPAPRPTAAPAETRAVYEFNQQTGEWQSVTI
jgi:hypothetical protein